MEPGFILDGRYRIERMLGAGGMGEVWLAWDSNLERLVALKRIKPEYMEDRGHLDMFMAEARQTANLRHPRIVTVLDKFESDGSLWMSMVYIEGQNLDQALSSGLLPVSALEIALRDVLEGLDYLHSTGGILHRDIKPANILLDGKNRAFITDFGIARLSQRTGNTATEPGVFGSPNYIAPEVMEGAPASTASDVWAFGAVALKAFAGVFFKTGVPAHAFAGAFTPMIRDALSLEPGRRPTARQLLTGWDLALAAPSAASEAPTTVQSVVPAPVPADKPKRSKRIAVFVLAGLLALAAAIFGIPAVLSALNGEKGGEAIQASTPPASTPAAAETRTETSTPTPTPTAETTTPTPTPDSATPTAVPPPVSAANPGPKTFNLTDVEYTRNEFYWVPSEATIGTKEFRNSIKGENHTTNSITFGLGGACTELTVSVGQDAFSPRQGGPITFTVLLNDSEAASASVGPYEEAKELVVNLTGITNLKLVENRTAKDGHSVWGSPVLTCSRNPAPAR